MAQLNVYVVSCGPGTQCMNVAVSRARCAAVLVCSPVLLHVGCTTAAHIPFANAVCDFVERAVVVDAAGNRPFNDSNGRSIST
jgi:hypothetical protein